MKDKKKIKLCKGKSSIDIFVFTYIIYVWDNELKEWYFDGDMSGVTEDELMDSLFVDTIMDYIRKGYEVIVDA